jgi:hypothetical protein
LANDDAIHPIGIEAARASASAIDNVENLRRRPRDAQLAHELNSHSAYVAVTAP